MGNLKLFSCFTFFLSILLLLSYTTPGLAHTLSTKSRWIVDEHGQRVKIAGITWPAHMETMLAEGLDKDHLDVIVKRIVEMRFNTVRLTWPTYLMTNASYASVTVKQSFHRLGDKMNATLHNIKRLNQDMMDCALVDVFKKVLTCLKDNNLMVILDNHITVPGWCCNENDGNGFFGDKYFDPEVWLDGLTRMATLSKEFPNVVGMSLRNEPRGPKQNPSVWMKEMVRGAEAVHKANPNLLVIMSGLNSGTSFAHLQGGVPKLSFNGKLVFEVHRYSFTDGDKWAKTNHNEFCAKVTDDMTKDSLFLLEKGYPIIVGEFGQDQRGNNVNDNRFMTCFVAILAEHDLDWVVWGLAGSYYIRGGQPGFEEVLGMQSFDWRHVRNRTNLIRLQGLKEPFRGPGLPEKTYKMMYHPRTGWCMFKVWDCWGIGPCDVPRAAWIYKDKKFYSYNLFKDQCVQYVRENKPVQVLRDCNEWEPISATKMHWKTTAEGKEFCFDIDRQNTLMPVPCKCISGDVACDPTMQWIKVIDTSRVPQLVHCTQPGC
ncbi:hypothetical protein ACFE04_022234 [Oxalis oulophora]